MLEISEVAIIARADVPMQVSCILANCILHLLLIFILIYEKGVA